MPIAGPNITACLWFDTQAEEAAKFSGLLGESASIKEALMRIAEVARASDTTVLLTGESG